MKLESEYNEYVTLHDSSEMALVLCSQQKFHSLIHIEWKRSSKSEDRNWWVFVTLGTQTCLRVALMALHWSNIFTFLPFLFSWVFCFCLLFHLLSPCKSYFLWVNFRLGLNEFNNCGKFFSFPLRNCDDIIIYYHINYPMPFQKPSGLTWSKGLQSFLQSSSLERTKPVYAGKLANE